MARRFSTGQRVTLLLGSGAICEGCGVTLVAGWHADHAYPHSRGGATHVLNGRATCPRCNLTKGARVTQLGPWPEDLVLREWQRGAFDDWLSANKADFLLNATPGAGKTIAALRAAHYSLSRGDTRRIVVTVPTEHLRYQWTEAALRCGIQLNPNWVNGDGFEADGFHGIVVTYAAVGRVPDVYQKHCAMRPTFYIGDEIHHAADNRTWGDSQRIAFSGAVSRYMVTGTAFRGDGRAIPFVTYVNGLAKADSTYNLSRAISDRVCRPVIFPHFDGTMEWYSRSETKRHTFADELSLDESARRLRTALDLRGEWLSSVLKEADQELIRVRAEEQWDAGGLVVCIDQAHAKGVAELLARITGEQPALAISEEPDASDRIKAYAKASHRWIVAVRMISEGVDIPRLRVGVYATNIISILTFRQVVGRFVRGANEPAYIYLPADAVLMEYARQLLEEQEIALKEAVEQATETIERREDANRQISMYYPIDARDPTQTGLIWDGQATDQAEFGRFEAAARRNGARTKEQVLMVLATLRDLGVADNSPPLRTVAVASAPVTSLADQIAMLRTVHTFRTRDFAKMLKPYALLNDGAVFKGINRKLANETGGFLPSNPTLEQYEARIRVLEQWGVELSIAEGNGDGRQWVLEWAGES